MPTNLADFRADQLSSAASIVRTALDSLPDVATHPLSADAVITNAAAIAEIAQALNLLADSVRWVNLTLVTHLPSPAELREQGMSPTHRKAVDRLRNDAHRALKATTTAAYALDDHRRTAQQLANTAHTPPPAPSSAAPSAPPANSQPATGPITP